MRVCRVFAAVLLLLAPLSALAQYSIADIVFEHGDPYTDAELLSVSGLATGQFLAHDSLANAAQHLIDTGLFSDAQVSLSGQGKARTVHVAVQPIPLGKLLPVSFENFVWFTPEALAKGVHERVPLYRGVAAEAGNTPDAIQAALKQMLADKGIAAKVAYQMVAPTVEHPVRVVDYAVVQPVVRVADVKLSFEGSPEASRQLAPGLQKAVSQTIHTVVNEGMTGITIEDRLLAPARAAGFVRARLDRVERTVEATANGAGVTYTAQLVSGESYKVSAVNWTPTAIYSAADLSRDAVLHAGDAANVEALNKTASQIADAYLAKGYMDVTVVAPPVFNETNHTVAYTLNATPGEVYHVKTVTPLNLSPEAQREFDSVWMMKPGDIYSAAYVVKFVQKNTTSNALPHLEKYAAGFQASADPDTKLVEVTITFVPSAH